MKKLIFTKDYVPAEQQIISDFIAEGIVPPSKIEISASVVEVEFSEDISATDRIKIQEIVLRYGFFLN